MSRTGSESDSLLDLYKRTPNGSNVNVNHTDHDIPENMYGDEDDPHGWIHRDKLAKIESEELQAAGISLPTTRRKMSTSRNGRRGQSGERINDDTQIGTQKPFGREEKRQRISSPVEEEDGPLEHAHWDLRSPEEIAADEANQTGSFYINPVLRKSGSRIPVMTSSPLPIPQEHIERESPLPRSRATSGNHNDSQETGMPRFRQRGNSVGSQNLLDDGEALNGNGTPTPTQVTKSATPSSPTKTKITKSPTPMSTPTTTTSVRKITPAPRKASGPFKAGLGANSSPNARPGTRSGETDRPRTAVNRPEGDAPWIATMYKPDPRLPQDQQIIPTHAKRQQQAQWSEEGAIPTTYDRGFSPLAVHTTDGLKQPTSPTTLSDKIDDANAWPLRPMSSVRTTSSNRPGTSGSTTAGYSTMPKVVTSPLVGTVQSPKIQSPESSNSIPPRMQMQQQHQQPQQQLPPADLSEKQEKSCGCCVVM